MGGEEQASSHQDAENDKNNMQVAVDALSRSTVNVSEQQDPNTGKSDMHADVTHPIPSQLDVMESVRSLLSSSIKEIKSGNQSNGYQVGRGWKTSMERKPWEHLQYAYNYLVRP